MFFLIGALWNRSSSSKLVDFPDHISPFYRVKFDGNCHVKLVICLEICFVSIPYEVHCSHCFVVNLDSIEDVRCLVEYEVDAAAEEFKSVSEGDVAVIVINSM